LLSLKKEKGGSQKRKKEKGSFGSVAIGSATDHKDEPCKKPSVSVVDLTIQ